MNALLVAVFFSLSVENVLSSFCYSNSSSHYKYFSCKTPYNFIRGDIRDSVVHIKGCEPIALWGLIRHGKREPGPYFSGMMKSALVIQNYVVNSHAAGNSSLCAQDVENLKNWQINNRMFENFNELTDEGYEDMEGIGKRLKQAFPSLLGNLSEKKYMIKPASGHWIEKSAEAFITGFNDEKLTYVKPQIRNEIAAPYITCKKFQTRIHNWTETYFEAIKYLQNPEYLAAKDRIHRRTGIDYVLNDDNITALYDLCRYNSSGYEKKLSPWCALFTTEDLKVLEYIGDLRQYYRNGYGSPMAKKLGHVTLTNLLNVFQEAKDGDGMKLVTYITHSTVLDMIFTSLGLFKDETPLTSAKRNPKRKWRPANMSTFSSSFIAILQRCALNDTNGYNVVFYSNEKPLKSLCNDGVCSWEEFERILTFDNVNLDFCDDQS